MFGNFAGAVAEKIFINTDKRELEGLIQEVEEVEKDLENESKILGTEKLVTSVVSLFADLVLVRYNCEVLQKLVKRIEYTTEEQITAENSSKRLQTEFNAVFPDTCPLCGKPK